MDKMLLGWFVHDVVEIKRIWCPICTKARLHEKYQGWLICIGCGEKTFEEAPLQVEEAPKFQIERFINENK